MIQGILGKVSRVPLQLLDISRHPLNRGRGAQAIMRWLRWQLASRIAPGPIVVPFVDRTVLVARPGETGVTGNIFYGLAEYADMAFALHYLEPGDLFVDVGCNVATYSILASGVRGANSIAIDPVPSTLARARTNILANALQDRIELVAAAVGSTSCTVAFTTTQDTCNHVSTGQEEGDQIDMRPLDEILAGRSPALLKVDVEGYEAEVFRGAGRTLSDRSLLAVIVEINSAYERYGYTLDDVVTPLLNNGFCPSAYDPARRELRHLAGIHHNAGNTIFVRDGDAVSRRLRNAPPLESFSFGGRPSSP